jgi:hypothetical protein
MPLLTVTNLITSDITIQDPAGSISIKVPGSGAVTNLVVTEDQLAGVEAQLNAEQAAGALRWSSVDNPASAADDPPGSPAVVDRARYVAHEDDFLLNAGGTLPAPFAKDLNAGGTGDYVANAAGGVYLLATVAVSEAEDAQLTFGNQKVIDPSKAPIFEARVLINMPGATITADERWVVGLCSDHTNSEDGLDAVVSNVWFKGEGANLNILIEADDGTTDTDDRDTTLDYVKNTYMLLKIDMTDLTKIKFYVNGVQASTTLSAPLLSAATLLQPIFCYQRDAGSEINQLKVDWYRVYSGRT